MPSHTPARVLEQLGLAYRGVAALSDAPSGNGNWLVETASEEPVVLRRYRAPATVADLGYEHDVLRHLDAAGWTVPVPVSDLVQHDGAWYCLTRYVPGAAVRAESALQRHRRGRDLARLHLALRGLAERIGQRPGYHPQHSGITTRTGFGWDATVRALGQANPRLAAWAYSAADQVHDALNAAGAHALPLTVIHGDFAEWNVHYQHGRLSGVIDFDLTHLDSRPYELAIARTYRAPEAADSYRAELARRGWPLSDLEEAAIGPVYRAFRLGMAAWDIHHGRETGHYNEAMIERQLSMTGTPRPLGGSCGLVPGRRLDHGDGLCGRRTAQRGRVPRRGGPGPGAPVPAAAAPERGEPADPQQICRRPPRRLCHFWRLCQFWAIMGYQNLPWDPELTQRRA